ncbi:response regulator [Sphingomonas sp. ABOLD]|uniref:Two-component system response regulator FixJ n=1 Tax=Sphingomonas trueperi TaxID=53317 RepID=A0A7X6BCW9_9SPHN|nr:MULTISPECIES: response regulator [Sphingomonas]NJB97680.1 two-component system response regulator FixJ [Sphingomonas trueperi]RSV43509.1 response regulator [Sphingomonas sp. ABOLE]RSV52882.1 response regulator [Sphingomonas sp. ABOLD]
MTRTIYIVDDDDAVRASLHSLLSVRPDLIVRGYRSGDAFLEQEAELDAGVVLLDFHMPGSSGLDVLLKLDRSPKFVPIVLTGQGNVGLAVQAMKAGALDFIEKPYEAEFLLKVIDQAFSKLEEDGEAAARTATAESKIAKLSPRETDVLKGLIEGRSNKIIAYELDISPRTVEIYRANLMEKLEVRSLSEALRIAFAAGLFPKG